jgi:hypothetical protein
MPITMLTLSARMFSLDALIFKISPNQSSKMAQKPVKKDLNGG